jgi:hypothetical protein
MHGISTLLAAGAQLATHNKRNKHPTVPAQLPNQLFSKTASSCHFALIITTSAILR